MTQIKIATFNARGLNEKKKRTDVFSWLKKKKYDICLLQEVHSTKNVESYWETEWGYKCFFHSFNGNSKGVAILFKNSFSYTIKKVITDTDGRLLILNMLLNDLNVTIANVYGPNVDDPVFYKYFKTKIEEFENSHLILGGDYNVVQNFSLDTNNIQNRNNPKSQEVINEIKEDLDLSDPWRVNNPDTRTYTWHNSRHQQSRLDYFLVSHDILQNIKKSSIKPGYRSDHSVVDIIIELDKQKKGPGIWKFNNSLLKEEQYVNQIKTCISNTLNQYKDNSVPVREQNMQNYSISDKLLFEVIKMEIRGTTIAYTAHKKKKDCEREKYLDTKIDTLHQKYIYNPSDTNLIQLNETQKELKMLREKKVDGIILRAKAKWNVEGERNSKYFLNLENQHYKEKTINKLIDDHGNELTKIDDILNEQKMFYQSLYSTKVEENSDRNEIYQEFFPNEEYVKKLDDEQAQSIEGEITVQECYNVLKNMKKNKSPGSDGFTSEFYLHFWEDLKIPMIRSFQQSYKDGTLSDSQKLGIITSLPKPGKDKEYIKNWRPVTLLNVDYKILSGVIAKRIQLFLDPLISETQKGFVKDRFIGECTRLVSDIIHHLRKSKQPGIILLIDFAKAFDSLEWGFINKTLKYFNFGDGIQKWVKIFYNRIESCVINNGHCSERFGLQRGVRQGDPLSPYLFILAAQILTTALQNNQNIKGIKIDNTEYLLSQLADDTTLFLENDELSFRTCLNVLGKFSIISGLEINYSKTVGIKIGISNNLKYSTGGGKNIQWQSNGKFTLLGIKYNLDQEDFTETNYVNKLKEIESCLNCWIGRHLTIYGRICIIKSLALPKLVHLFSSIPNPPERIIKGIEDICFKFIWNNKSERIKRNILCNDYEKGGFRMLDIKMFCMAQKLVWVKKLLDDTNFSKWKLLFLTNVQNHGGNYIWLADNFMESKVFDQINPFWKDVIKAWNILTKPKEIDPREEALFYNGRVKINGRSIFLKEWNDNGIQFINDLLDNNGEFYSIAKWLEIYNLKKDVFKYVSLIHSIPRNWKKRIKEIGTKLNNVVKTNITLTKNLKKPGKYFYKKYIENNYQRPIKSEKKWGEILEQNLDEIEWQFFYSIPYKVTKDMKLRSLQMKIIHRTIPTNSWLFKCNLTNTNHCSFCNINIESISHLFWECHTSKNIWFKLKDWLLKKDENLKMDLGQREIMLGENRDNFSKEIEHIKLITKEYIYNSKIQNKKPIFQELTAIINMKQKIERYHIPYYL